MCTFLSISSLQLLISFLCSFSELPFNFKNYHEFGQRNYQTFLHIFNILLFLKEKRPVTVMEIRSFIGVVVISTSFLKLGIVSYHLQSVFFCTFFCPFFIFKFLWPLLNLVQNSSHFLFIYIFI